MIIVQVNLFQNHLFFCQLTHNMTKDCSLVDARIRASDKYLPVLPEFIIGEKMKRLDFRQVEMLL